MVTECQNKFENITKKIKINGLKNVHLQSELKTAILPQITIINYDYEFKN